MKSKVKLIAGEQIDQSKLVLIDHPDIVIPFAHCEIDFNMKAKIASGTITFALTNIEWEQIVAYMHTDLAVNIQVPIEGNDYSVYGVTSLKIVIDALSKTNEAVFTVGDRDPEAPLFSPPISASRSATATATAQAKTT